MNATEWAIREMGGPEKVRAELCELIVALNINPVPLTMSKFLDECDRMLRASKESRARR